MSKNICALCKQDIYGDCMRRLEGYVCLECCANEQQDKEVRCDYVVKTWIYEIKTNTIDYAGLVGYRTGFRALEKAKVLFENTIKTGKFVAVELIKIDPDANEDRETIILSSIPVYE